jgi:nucleotide-binding universal stress UspA family protein
MFKHVLIPTDGSALSGVALAHGVALAERLDAKVVARAEASAKEKGVNARGIHVVAEHPYEAIIEAAESRGCDLILMASHGRSGLAELWYGSETHDVLTHSRIPTLVYR